MLFAADRSDVPLMRLLLELGADPLIPNFKNTTPLMAAAGLGTKEAMEEAGEESEAVEAVNLLLDRGADINGVDNNGDTAMHGAAENMYPQVVNLLARRGADPAVWSKPNKQGRTPLFIAEGYVGSELTLVDDTVPTRGRDETRETPSQQPLRAISAGSPSLQSGCFLAITGTDT